MGNLTQLWNEACEAVSFDVPATGIGLGAVGSLARGQVGPSSDLDLVVIYEPHALTDQQLNELANKLWYPIWIPASTSTSRYVPSRNARPSPTATCPQLWDGWTWCRSRGTLDLSKAQPYPYWNDGARPHANVCRNCSAPPNRASTNSAAWPTSTSRTSKRHAVVCATPYWCPRSPHPGLPTVRTARMTTRRTVAGRARLHPSGRRQRYEHAAIALPSQSRGDARSGRSDAARWRT